MALPNPVYIGENALHQPPAIRLLAYGLTTGVQGVLGSADCAIRALGAPAAAIQAMPGAYMVRAKHLGGSYEGYAGKFDVAEQVSVPPVGSSGTRRDLVVLVIKDPYVSGAGSWPEPADLVNGPYAEIRVIQNVSATTWDITQLTSGEQNWSAITLARIDRPANTTIVTDEHITNLRSLAALGGTRTVVIENPPVTIPPIAQSFFMQANQSTGNPNYDPSVPATDNVHDYFIADTNWKNWPDKATWQVPVPEWAREMDIDCQVFGAQILTGDAYGQFTMTVNGSQLAPLVVAVDFVQVPSRHTIAYSGTFPVDSSIRGKIVTFRTRLRSYYSFTGQNSGRRFDAKHGTTSRLMVNFQRVPD